MDDSDRSEMQAEWAKVLRDHPKFARAFLAQQAVLIEAAELGDSLTVASMCKALALGYPVPFVEYWTAVCKKKKVRIELTGVLECLRTARNPQDCFSLPQEVDWNWFNDPFEGGHVLPPKPPTPPLTRPR